MTAGTPSLKVEPSIFFLLYVSHSAATENVGAHRWFVAWRGREPHTTPMLEIGWMILGIEVIFSIFFCFVFWHFWSRSAMKRSVAIRAFLIYALGCTAFLLLMFFMPMPI